MSFEIKPEDLDFDDSNVIGEGASSSVLKGTWCGNIVAVKVLKRTSDNTYLLLKKELELLHALRHPNIVQLFGVSSRGQVKCIVLEYADGGSLFDFLKKYTKVLTLANSKKFLLDLASGMEYLHSRKPPIIHGDLKSSNVLLTNSTFGIEAVRLKITDFGLSKTRSTTSSDHTNGSITGTLRWMSPERMDRGALKEAVDVYAYAMTAYEIVSLGKIPFEELPSEAQVVFAVTQQRRPQRPVELVNDDIWALIEACWSHDAKKRPSFNYVRIQLNDFVKVNDVNESTSSASYAFSDPSSTSLSQLANFSTSVSVNNVSNSIANSSFELSPS
ncbi:hypothetical protein HK096_008565, partial [Nowakowskiella sp. JEL0078]